MKRTILTILTVLLILVLALTYAAWVSASNPMDDCEDNVITPLDDDDCDDDDDDKKPTKTPTITPTMTPVFEVTAYPPQPTYTPFPTQPIISGEVKVVNVWTATMNWFPKTSFFAGEEILWVMDIYSTFPNLVDVVLTWQVVGPNGENILYNTFTVITGDGVWSWGLPGEALEVYGEHTFIGYSFHNNLNASKMITYQVENVFIGTNKYYIPLVIMDWRMQPEPVVGSIGAEMPTIAPTVIVTPLYVRKAPTLMPTLSLRATPTYAPTMVITQQP